MFARLFSRNRRPARQTQPEQASPAAADSHLNDLFGSTPPDISDTLSESPPTKNVIPSPAPSCVTQPPPPEPPLSAERQQLEALIAQENWPKAKALFARLPSGLTAPWYLLAGQTLAERQQKWQTVIAFSKLLRAADPGNAAGYLAGCSALRHLRDWPAAEAVATAGIAAVPECGPLWAEAALASEGLGALVTAEEHWARVRQLLPTDPAGWTGACALALRLQQHAKASTLLQEALRLFPAEIRVNTLAARHETAAKHWAEAERYWRAAITASNQDPALLLEAAKSLIGPKIGRPDRMPRVLALLDALRRDHPDFEEAYTLQVSALVDAGQAAAALDLGQELRVRAPSNATLAIACANAAFACGRPEETLAILLAARDEAEPTAELEAAAIRALSQAGSTAQAEEVSAAALKRFPGESRIVEQYVGIAMRAGDMDEASRRAAYWRDQNPDNRALVRLADRLAAPTLSNDPGAAQAPRPGRPLAALFTRFESLGALSGGCEFGFIQSKFKAEPISLLRWANLGIDGLTRALDTQFAGLGEPEHTKMKIRPVGGGEEEYFVRDDRYGYVAHTFIKTHEAPGDKVFAQTLRRIRFLRGKLVEDLALAEKIFVFKLNKIAEYEKVDALFTALRKYGQLTLLCVALGDEKHPGGTVEMIRPGLFLGRVNMLGGAGMTQDRGIDGESWRLVCEQVAAWHDTRQTEAAA